MNIINELDTLIKDKQMEIDSLRKAREVISKDKPKVAKATKVTTPARANKYVPLRVKVQKLMDEGMTSTKEIAEKLGARPDYVSTLKNMIKNQNPRLKAKRAA